MPETSLILLLVHAAATWFMVGLIWFVQVVHYPLFARVGEEGYEAYHRSHMAWMGYVVGPVMLVEAAAAGLVVLLSPAGVPAWMGAAGAVLLGLVWASTFFVQVPQHHALAGGFDPSKARAVVVWNWPRTFLWTGRGVVALAMLWAALGAGDGVGVGEGM